MNCLDFDWQIDAFMVFCRSTQLREKTMNSYEQTLRLFERWCRDELSIDMVDKVTESVMRRYINDLQERGKYSFYTQDAGKGKNYPERRRDYRKHISVVTINNYIRNMVFADTAWFSPVALELYFWYSSSIAPCCFSSAIPRASCKKFYLIKPLMIGMIVGSKPTIAPSRADTIAMLHSRLESIISSCCLSLCHFSKSLKSAT